MTQWMPYFAELGEQLDAEWGRKLYDERALPALAEAALLASPPHLSITPDDVVAWGLTASFDAGGAGEFGEPPVVVYRARRFFIEVLFWFDSTTSIHQHSFDGAFCVLAGSSVHSRYRFKETGRTSSRLIFGDVEFESAELLKQGAVHQIHAGDKFIHALFHLDRPSVSIVVRNDYTPVGVQYSYLPPYVGYNQLEAPVINQRCMQFLRALRETRSERAAELTARGLERIDDLGLMRAAFMLSQWKEEFTNDDVDEEDDATSSSKKADATVRDIALSMYDACREACRARMGNLSDALFASISVSIRASDLVSARQRVRTPELRFFLALLMNVPNRARVLELVKERYPATDPVDTILEWIGQLSDGSTLDYELGEDTINLLGYVLRGFSRREAAAELAKSYKREFTPAEVEAVEATLEGLSHVEIFRPLLATESAPRIEAFLSQS